MKQPKCFPVDARNCVSTTGLIGVVGGYFLFCVSDSSVIFETNYMFPACIETELESAMLTFCYFRFPTHRGLGFLSSFLLFVTKRVLVFVYRRFRASYQPHLFGLFDP
jgi:hypothetical protein